MACEIRTWHTFSKILFSCLNNTTYDIHHTRVTIKTHVNIGFFLSKVENDMTKMKHFQIRRSKRAVFQNSIFDFKRCPIKLMNISMKKYYHGEYIRSKKLQYCLL